jgi:hypothetical protein
VEVDVVEARDECGHGESEVDDETDGREASSGHLTVVAVVKEEVDAEAVEVKERSSGSPAPFNYTGFVHG